MRPSEPFRGEHADLHEHVALRDRGVRRMGDVPGHDHAHA
jgi:hypothetical protein